MWQIACIKNEVEINKKIAKALLKCEDDGLYYWDQECDPLDWNVGFADRDGKYRLYFNEDQCEHMDFVGEEEVQKVLCKNKVKGDICFGSLEGDNAGRFWGYRFDGKGGYKRLKAVIAWQEVKE
jgi:hypothetical protein